MDGLLHVTDVSWGRVGHPSEVLKPKDFHGKFLIELENLEIVVVVPLAHERIALVHR